MKFKCPKCNMIIDRDMRETANKNNLTPKGYKTVCFNNNDEEVIVTPVYNSAKEWEKITNSKWFKNLMIRLKKEKKLKLLTNKGEVK